MSRFDYVKYDEKASLDQSLIKQAFQEAESKIDMGLIDGRAKSLALTYLEIAYMWAGKAIRDEQIGRGVQVESVPERSNQ